MKNFILSSPLIWLLFIQYFQVTHSSVGETLPLFHSCVLKCHTDFCQQSEYSPKPSLIRKCKAGPYPTSSIIFNWLIQILWSCDDDCEYDCMWPVIHFCLQKQWGVPQFHGKWPFIRWFGMQEPASAIFSFFNLVSISYMYRKFYTAVRHGSAMSWMWTIYTMVSVNTWFWSIIFHIRDTPFSELMDYIGATSLIYVTLGVFGFRILLYQNWYIKLLFLGGCLFFFSQHVLDLLMRPVNYYRNFDTLLLIALVTGASTMIWCLWNWRKASHMQFAATYITLILIMASLEIFDFPPILWTFDAHALWHLATVPLQFFIYKFAAEDCRYLHRLHQQKIISTVVYQNIDVLSVQIQK